MGTLGENTEHRFVAPLHHVETMHSSPSHTENFSVRRCGDLVSRQRTPNTNFVSGKAPLFLTLHPKTSPHSAPLPRMV